MWTARGVFIACLEKRLHKKEGEVEKIGKKASFQRQCDPLRKDRRVELANAQFD